MPAPRILALDLATVGAAAWTRHDLGGVETTDFNLLEKAVVPKAKAAACHGMIFRALHTLVGELIALARPDVLAIEKDTARGYQTVVMQAGLRAIAELAAAQAGIRCVTDIDASTARTLAGVGGGSTSKAVATGRARMFEGLPTQTDDEVDAVILYLAVRARLADEARQVLAKPARRATKRRAA